MSGIRSWVGVCLTACLAVGVAGAADYGWDRGAGSDSWGAAANWNPDATTGDPAADDTIVDTGSNRSLLDTNRTINAFKFNGQASATLVKTLDLGGRTLTVLGANNALCTVGWANNGTYYATLVLNNGSLQLGSDATHPARLLTVGNMSRTDTTAKTVYGTLDAAAVPLNGWVDTVHVGVTDNGYGAGIGNLKLGTAALRVNKLYLGVSGSSVGNLTMYAGTLDVNELRIHDTTSTSHMTATINSGRLTVYSNLWVGAAAANNIPGVLKLMSGATLRLGASADLPATVYVGYNRRTSYTPYGTLDVSPAAVSGWADKFYVGYGEGTKTAYGIVKLGQGTLNVRNLYVGYAGSGYGTLTSSGTTLTVNDLRINDGSAKTTESSMTVSGGSLLVHTNFWVGEAAAANIYGKFMLTNSATLQLGAGVSNRLAEFHVGYNPRTTYSPYGQFRAANNAQLNGWVENFSIGHSALGAVAYGTAMLPPGTLDVTTLRLGCGVKGYGNLTLKSGAFLKARDVIVNDGSVNGGSTWMTLENGATLEVAQKLVVTDGAQTIAAYCPLNLKQGSTLRLGAVGAPAILRIGRKTSTQNRYGELKSVDGGTLWARLSELQVGYAAEGASGIAIGRLDLRKATSVDIAVQGDIEIGRGTAGNSYGYVYLGNGTVSAANLYLSRYSATTLGTLTLSNTVVTVNGSVVLDSYNSTTYRATLTLSDGARLCVKGAFNSARSYDSMVNTVRGTSGGLDLDAQATLSLTARYAMTFYNPLPTQRGVYWGLRWPGNHAAALAALSLANKISWDDTTYLTGENRDKVQIFYDPVTHCTYIGIPSKDPTWVPVAGADGGGVAYDFQIRSGETMAEEYAQFLNESAQGVFAVTNGEVRLAATTNLLCLTQAAELRSSLIYNPAAAPGARFSVVSGRGKHPVTYVTWFGAAAYCNWLSGKEGFGLVYDPAAGWAANLSATGYRLPQESEWYKAAAWDSAGQRFHVYATGLDTLAPGDANYFNSGDTNETAAVRTSPIHSYDTTSPSGLKDACGNVWEWCHGFYTGGSDPAQDAHAVRGGGWGNLAIDVKAGSRCGNKPGDAKDNVGFRVMRVSP